MVLGPYAHLIHRYFHHNREVALALTQKKQKKKLHGRTCREKSSLCARACSTSTKGLEMALTWTLVVIESMEA